MYEDTLYERSNHAEYIFLSDKNTDESFGFASEDSNIKEAVPSRNCLETKPDDVSKTPLQCFDNAVCVDIAAFSSA